MDLQYLRKYLNKSLQIYTGKQDRATKEMCQVLLKYIEPNGLSTDLKIASFFGFFQNVAFEIPRVFLARHHG